MNKTSRTTVYRALKYLEGRGRFHEPRKPIVGKAEPYRFYKEDVYKRRGRAGIKPTIWRRRWYSTPTRASHMLLVAKTKPDIMMLQGWCRVKIYKNGELLWNGVHFGTSVARTREKFRWRKAYKEMCNGALMDVVLRMSDTKQYLIIIKPLKPRGKYPGIRTVAYYKR